ncbi:MAG TPA: tripartite tricarboxylate transporter TctB family protein [Microvirga sp.]|nr:tripartite tricarboxylate transporter TctB family protein [Microvirga sp.]
MQFERSRRFIDWGHLALLIALAGLASWFLLDARAASLNINNLLLVQPTVLFVLGLILLIIPQCFRARSNADQIDAPAAKPNVVKTSAVALCLAAFVFLIDTIGFDTAMLLFVLGTMIICGERRPLPLLIYPLAVTLTLISGFKLLMPYPMTTLVL